LILDHGASEVVLTVNVEDADNLFDWLAASSEVSTTWSAKCCCSVHAP